MWRVSTTGSFQISEHQFGRLPGTGHSTMRKIGLARSKNWGMLTNGGWDTDCYICGLVCLKMREASFCSRSFSIGTAFLPNFDRRSCARYESQIYCESLNHVFNLHPVRTYHWLHLFKGWILFLSIVYRNHGLNSWGPKISAAGKMSV